MAFLRRAFNLGKEKLELESALTFPHDRETNVGRAIPPAILTALLSSKALTEKWPARGGFLRFAYLSGVRRGQLLKTRLAQFHPDTGSMTWRPEQTKTNDAHNVAYTGEALEILLGFWKARELTCPAFFQEHGAPVTADKLNEAWWAACREVGLPIGRKHGGYVIHELRHTMVSEWIHAGQPEKAIMDMTGHRAVQTLHRYGHASAEAQRAAQERVEAWRSKLTPAEKEAVMSGFQRGESFGRNRRCHIKAACGGSQTALVADGQYQLQVASIHSCLEVNNRLPDYCLN